MLSTEGVPVFYVSQVEGTASDDSGARPYWPAVAYQE